MVNEGKGFIKKKSGLERGWSLTTEVFLHGTTHCKTTASAKQQLCGVSCYWSEFRKRERERKRERVAKHAKKKPTKKHLHQGNGIQLTSAVAEASAPPLAWLEPPVAPPTVDAPPCRTHCCTCCSSCSSLALRISMLLFPLPGPWVPAEAPPAELDSKREARDSSMSWIRANT